MEYGLMSLSRERLRIFPYLFYSVPKYLSEM